MQGCSARPVPASTQRCRPEFSHTLGIREAALHRDAQEESELFNEVALTRFPHLGAVTVLERRCGSLRHLRQLSKLQREVVERGRPAMLITGLHAGAVK